MSRGSRQVKLQENKKVKKHLKGFYQTIGLISQVADELKESGVDVNETNVEKLAKDILGRDIDSLEKTLILGKLSNPNHGIE